MLTSTPTDVRKRDKKKGKKVEALNASSSKEPPLSALCEVVWHPNNMCAELDELKALMHVPKALVNPPTRNKTLRTNHACAICTEYRHYTHHCLEIP